MVLSFLGVLSKLHATDNVLCNGITLQDTLSQFLIRDDYSLVLATLDNLPSDSKDPVLCRTRELTGFFVAPEQKWPYGSTKIFNPDDQPRYNRSSDIWKVPDVVVALLTSSCNSVLDFMHAIHIRCKNTRPHLRPPAAEILEEYRTIWEMLNND